MSKKEFVTTYFVVSKLVEHDVETTLYTQDLERLFELVVSEVIDSEVLKKRGKECIVKVGIINSEGLGSRSATVYNTSLEGDKKWSNCAFIYGEPIFKDDEYKKKLLFELSLQDFEGKLKSRLEMISLVA